MSDKSILDLATEHAEQCREAASGGESCSLVSFKPLASTALEYHPDQVPEARAWAKAHGFAVEITDRGTPIFTSSRQMRAFAKAQGKRHLGY